MGIANETTLSAWYDEYGTDVLRYCFMFLGNRPDAEDATQETFLKAWRNIDRFEARDGCSPKTWIIKIAGNTCRDYRRSAWFRRVDRRADWADLSPDPSAQGPAGFLVRDDDPRDRGVHLHQPVHRFPAAGKSQENDRSINRETVTAGHGFLFVVPVLVRNVLNALYIYFLVFQLHAAAPFQIAVVYSL